MYVFMKSRVLGCRRVDVVVPMIFSFVLILLAIFHLASSVLSTRGKTKFLVNDIAFLVAMVIVIFFTSVATYKEPTPTVEVQRDAPNGD
ncbi:hypothetical protein Taro_033713, partial [Colocasia esculenta]|nr:hypothetical protein [Colocasia esculenta]